MKRITNSTPIKKVISAMLREEAGVRELFAAYLREYQVKQSTRALIKSEGDRSEVLRAEGGLVAEQAL